MRAPYLVALLLLLAGALACNATLGNVLVGTVPGCGDGVPPSQARVYAGEGFYICGNVYVGGELLPGGEIAGGALAATSAPVVNGAFSIYGTAAVNSHKYYYIGLALSEPCAAPLGAVPVEIRTNCMMVPPSTIEAVPDVVTVGESFSLQVKNAPEGITMSITGLRAPITALIAKGGSWSQSLRSDECSDTGSCVIRFSFTEQKHPLCTATADAVVAVRPAVGGASEERSNTDVLLIATLFVVVVGAAGAILLNRYL